MIVHLGVTLGALPKIDEVVHWMPVHTTARAIAEMRNTESTHLHVTHPHHVSTLVLLRTISDHLHLPLVPLAEWTARLERHVHTAPLPTSSLKLEDPALTLLRHLRAHAHEPTRMFGFDHSRIASDKAWHASPTLQGGTTALGHEDIGRWLQHWQESGMMP